MNMMNTVYSLEPFLAANYSVYELVMPLKGYRRFIAFTYIGCCLFGFLLNFWVLFVIATIMHSPHIRVPKSILFYILTLCVADLMTMAGMVFLNVEIVLGTWRFSSLACTAYLLFDSMNKFVAPIILVLISRTCYATICLNGDERKLAASVKHAFVRVLVAIFFVLVVLWPVFVYSTDYYMVRRNETTRTVHYLRKCSFSPPPAVELPFNVMVSVCSYAIPVFGFVYWYSRVPYYLWKLNSVNSTSVKRSVAKVIRRVIIIVVVFSMVYLVCWTPYWLGLYAHYFFDQIPMTKNKVIIMYFVHLLPYVSCAIYPAIFTLLNRPILTAHNKWRHNKRRELQTFTEKKLHDVASKTSKTTSLASSKLVDLLHGHGHHQGDQRGRRRANTYDKETTSSLGDTFLGGSRCATGRGRGHEPPPWKRGRAASTIANSASFLSLQFPMAFKTGGGVQQQQTSNGTTNGGPSAGAAGLSPPISTSTNVHRRPLLSVVGTKNRQQQKQQHRQQSTASRLSSTGSSSFSGGGGETNSSRTFSGSSAAAEGAQAQLEEDVVVVVSPKSPVSVTFSGGARRRVAIQKQQLSLQRSDAQQQQQGRESSASELLTEETMKEEEEVDDDGDSGTNEGFVMLERTVSDDYYC